MGQLKHAKLGATGSSGAITGNYNQIQIFNDATDDASMELAVFGTVLLPAGQWINLKASIGSFYQILDIGAGTDGALYYYLQA